uniref:Uncharacterized protein n=1 Tax=Vibrio splendidus TaxID=29497 RepID=A0A0H3ZUD2_VIBSP|nr:hypothetical protein [Vibrio splendidus]
MGVIKASVTAVTVTGGHAPTDTLSVSAGHLHAHVHHTVRDARDIG